MQDKNAAHVRIFKRPSRIFNIENFALQNSNFEIDYANVSALTILTCKLMLYKIEEYFIFTYSFLLYLFKN